MPRTQVAFIGGRSGVGKSSAAFALHDILVASDIAHAVVEGDLLDLAYPQPSGLVERNLRDLWGNYRERGFRRLIYTNTASVLHMTQLARAMGDDPETRGFLLRANDDTIRERLGGREHGDSLIRHLRRSSDAAAWLDAEAPRGVVTLDTDGLDPGEVAARIARHLGWE